MAKNKIYIYKLREVILFLVFSIRFLVFTQQAVDFFFISFLSSAYWNNLQWTTTQHFILYFSLSSQQCFNTVEYICRCAINMLEFLYSSIVLPIIIFVMYVVCGVFNIRITNFCFILLFSCRWLFILRLSFWCYSSSLLLFHACWFVVIPSKLHFYYFFYY